MAPLAPETLAEAAVEALREAIINAFCHRDYYDPDYIQMAIFKDRVEIRNPGTLYGNLTIEDLRKGNVSQRRNPLIADLFRRIEMVEAWGRGMPLILNMRQTWFSEKSGTVHRRLQPVLLFGGRKMKRRPLPKKLSKKRSKSAKRNPRETPKKHQRSNSRCPKETAFHQHQGTICSMRHECPQRTTPH